MNELSKELFHAYTAQQKHDYNVNYYREHSDLWKKFYNQGLNTGGKGMAARVADKKREDERNEFMADYNRRKADIDRQREEILRDIEKPVDEQIRDSLSEMKTFIKSDEFKAQLRNGIKIAKSVLPEMLDVSVELLNSTKNELVDLGKSVFASVFGGKKR